LPLPACTSHPRILVTLAMGADFSLQSSEDYTPFRSLCPNCLQKK